MKNNKGITLIALIVTIVVMMVIIGISVTGGGDTLQKSKMTEYIGYMKLVKARADVVLEDEMFENGSITEEALSNENKYYNDINNIIELKGYNNTSKYGIKIWKKDVIASQGIDSRILNEGNTTEQNDDDYFVVVFDKEEYQTADVLYSNGCKINSETYYSLNDCELAINGNKVIHLKNLIKDGGLETIGKVRNEGTTEITEKEGWLVNNSSTLPDYNIKKSGKQSIKLIGNAAGNEITCRYVNPYELEENHKYYVSSYVKDLNTSDNQLGFYYQYGEPSSQLYKTAYSENGWEKYSAVFDISQYKYKLYIRIDNDNWGGNRTVYFDEWHLVDLTEILDFNSEPVKSWTEAELKAWCDANLDYGVTEVAVPTN